MSLPSSATVLIVGAGPAGLVTALSLLKEGIKNIAIVDTILEGENTSRAMVIHAASLEALDTIGCAADLVKLGLKGKHLSLSGPKSSFITLSFEFLEKYTPYPFELLLSQARTEKVLLSHLEAAGVKVLRPFRVVGMGSSGSDGSLSVTFESGEVINTRYLIGADGAKSTIRNLSGIGFSDPDGLSPDESVDEDVGQFVLADVVFSDPGPSLSDDEVKLFGSRNGIFIFVPKPETNGEGKKTYRIGFTIPLSQRTPPSKPSLSYVQKHVNSHGPPQLSSDPLVNTRPIEVIELVWSTRFRTHSAIADTFFQQYVRGEGIVFLVGDSAHIHPPAGGLGMNLGIRDAVGLGTVIANHFKSTSPNDNTLLREYAARRRQSALRTITLTKRLLNVGTTLTDPGFLPLKYWMLKMLFKFSLVANFAVWRISGLGNR